MSRREHDRRTTGYKEQPKINQPPESAQAINDSALKDAGIKVRDLMFYVHTACNLRCDHCYVGDDWLNNAWSFDPNEAAVILDHFAQDGLDRLTFLGGEPTLYPAITELIQLSQEYNIDERRMTTNATRFEFLDLERVNSDDLDHVSVSFEGYTPQLHDAIRGEGTFEAALQNLHRLQDQGFDVHVTYTVMQPNIGSLTDAIEFFYEQGIRSMNFHLMSKIGNGADNEELAVAPEEWVQTRQELESYKPPAGMRLRIPYMFVTQAEFEEEIAEQYSHFQTGSYHSADDGHRIVLYPNGKVYMSCDLTGTDYNFARYEQGTFIRSEGCDELTILEENPEVTDPSAELLNKRTDGYIPVSISFKEIIEG